jgi:hypothetical protein
MPVTNGSQLVGMFTGSPSGTRDMSTNVGPNALLANSSYPLPSYSGTSSVGGLTTIPVPTRGSYLINGTAELTEICNHWASGSSTVYAYNNSSSNTGGVVPSGGLTIDGYVVPAGTFVFQFMNFNESITLQAPAANVLLRGCRIRGPAPAPGMVYAEVDSGDPAVEFTNYFWAHYCDMGGWGSSLANCATVALDVEVGAGIRWLRNYISYIGTGFQPNQGGACDVIENYIDKITLADSTWHLNGVALNGGNLNCSILRNHIVVAATDELGNAITQTDCIALFQDFGTFLGTGTNPDSTTGYVIDSNYVGGTGYCFYLGQNSGTAPTTVEHLTFTNNLVTTAEYSTGGANGPVAAVPTWSGTYHNAESNNLWADGSESGQDIFGGGGTPTITGNAAVTIPKPSVAASGTEVETGTGAVRIPKPSVAAAGLVILLNSARITVPKPSVAAAGDTVDFSSGAVRIPKPKVSGLGFLVPAATIMGVAAVTIPKPSVALSGTLSIPGTAAVRIPKPAAAGIGTPVIIGSAAVTIPKPAVSAHGKPIDTGDAAITVPKPGVAGHGAPVVLGAAASVSAVTSHAVALNKVMARAASVSAVRSAMSGFIVRPARAASVSAVSTTATALNKVVAQASDSSITTSSATASRLLARPPLPSSPRPQPTWQRDVQRFAITQERQRHVQALWQFGELAVFCLMWTAADEAAGLVVRCQRCFANPSLSTEDRISASYGQGNQYACTDCFGTQFEGGYRALIVRPAIFTDMDKGQTKSAKGVVQPGSLGIETTPDFRVRPGDYCFRSDGDRFQLRQPKRTTLRTGFAEPWQADAAIDYNQLNAALEDPASVAYQIPPAQAELAQVLGTYTRITTDFSWFEVIRAPLIPSESPPPAASARLQPTVTLG